MTTERIEVRLDPLHRRRLAQIAEDEQLSVSEAIRRMIDERFERRLQEKRVAAAERLVSREIEEVPDPDELSRQLAEAHAPAGMEDSELDHQSA